MSPKSRVRRLATGLMTSRPKGKTVEIIPAIVPAIEWETPTGLILRVPPDDCDQPEIALTDEQRASIGPHDDVFVSCPPRICFRSSRRPG